MTSRINFVVTCLACIFLSCLSACADMPSSQSHSPRQAAPAVSAQAPSAKTFQFQDGGQAIYFSLDKFLADTPRKPASGFATFLFVVSGSGCTSMQYFLPEYLRGLEGESGPIRIFILHKRFIAERTWGRGVDGCSAAFSSADHPARWIADQTEFIRAQLEMARKATTAPSRIVILGISEGGDIAPLLAQGIAGVTHVAILANGGMNPIDAYRLQAKKYGFVAAIDALDDPAASFANPDSPLSRLGGRSWRYWSELRALQQTANLLTLRVPILMAMGEADEDVPIESAWYARDQFALRGKTNLTLISYPGAKHGLQNDKELNLPNFWHALDLWLIK